MKIKFNVDSQLTEERAEFWLQKMTPKIDRIAKELAQDKESLWCFQDKKVVPVSFDEIILILVERQKLKVFTKNEEYEYKSRLYQVMKLLPADFLAASRSAVINYHKIDHLEMLDNGNIDAILENKMRVQFSRRKIKTLKERLEI